MKTTILAMLLLASCILAACTRSSPNIQLVQADSLIQKFPDSALHFLQGIQPKGLHLAADRAYYALLLTQVKDKNFIHQTEDSLIRIAVQYYDSTKNTAMQARAHYYLGCIWRNKDDHPEALKEFFKAITYSKRIFDNSLTGHIYNNIAYLYYLQRLNEQADSIYQITLKSATKLFSVLLASKRPLITELADKLRLKYPLLPTISPCPTMRLEAIRSIIPISCRRYPKSV